MLVIAFRCSRAGWSLVESRSTTTSRCPPRCAPALSGPSARSRSCLATCFGEGGEQIGLGDRSFGVAVGLLTDVRTPRPPLCGADDRPARPQLRGPVQDARCRAAPSAGNAAATAEIVSPGWRSAPDGRGAAPGRSSRPVRPTPGRSRPRSWWWRRADVGWRRASRSRPTSPASTARCTSMGLASIDSAVRSVNIVSTSSSNTIIGPAEPVHRARCRPTARRRADCAPGTSSPRPCGSTFDERPRVGAAHRAGHLVRQSARDRGLPDSRAVRTTGACRATAANRTAARRVDGRMRRRCAPSCPSCPPAA